VVVDWPVANLFTDVALGIDAEVESVGGEVLDVRVAVDGVEDEGGLVGLAVEVPDGLLIRSPEFLLGGLDNRFDLF
jgi:hypothetical protein